jgi:hypothetical protein
MTTDRSDSSEPLEVAEFDSGDSGTLEGRVSAAIERVAAEREHVADELRAYDRFDASVRDIEPATAAAAGGRPATDGGAVTRARTAVREDSMAGPADRVREAFAETVRPYSVADVDDGEPLVETLAAELGDGIAATLSPTTPGRLTPEVKDAIRSAVDRRRAELRATENALETEADSLETARETFDEVVVWLLAADERPLSSLGFEDLRRRHETLATFRSRCSDVAADRQAVLRRTTSDGPKAGVSHDTLVEFLYQDAPTAHPVLTTAVRLDSVCASCQRTVRDHLVRRV